MKAFLLTLVFALAACAPAGVQPPPRAAQERVALLWTADTRAVLTGDAALALTHQCSRISPGPVQGQWTPTPAELDELESHLILLLSQQLEAQGEAPSPGDYYRQYAGFVIGGRRVIYVNGVSESAVHESDDPGRPFDWRTQAMAVCDGGPIVFGVEYDPATHTFTHFAFNGAI